MSDSVNDVKGMTPGGFLDELYKMANEQLRLANRIRGFLTKSGVKYDWYCDWLDEWCLSAGTQIPRLTELYRQAHPECENQRNETKEDK